jgi:hypothetical protein
MAPTDTVNEQAEGPSEPQAMRELTVDELTAQRDAVADMRYRVRQAVAWAVDHEPYANVEQVDRILTVIDYELGRIADEYTDRAEARKERDTEDAKPWPWTLPEPVPGSPSLPLGWHVGEAAEIKFAPQPIHIHLRESFTAGEARRVLRDIVRGEGGAAE